MAAPQVLVVEDDPDQTAICAAILQHRGYQVLCARNGAEGLAIARAAHPGAVLLDLHLPDMHGLEVFAALRGDEETARIPVVVMTADVIQHPAAATLAAGIAAYLPKPFLPSRLLVELDRLIAPAAWLPDAR